MSTELKISLVNEGPQQAEGPLTPQERGRFDQLHQQEQMSRDEGSEYYRLFNRDYRNPQPQQAAQSIISKQAEKQAKEELEAAEYRKEVELAKRLIDERYDQQQTERELHRELSREIMQLTDARRKERLAVEQMTEDEKRDYDVRQEITRQRDQQDVKQAAYEQRLVEDPEFAKEEAKKDAERERKRKEREALEDERLRRAAMTPEQRADEDAREEVQERKLRHDARMKNDSAYRKREEERARREYERDFRAQMTEQQRADADAREEVEAREQRHQARMKVDADYRQREADRVHREDARREKADEQARRDAMTPVERAVEDAQKRKDQADVREQADRMVNPQKYAERDRKAAERDRKEAENQQYEAFGPFAGTVKAWVRAYKALTGKSQQPKAAEPEPAGPAPAAPQPASTPTARPAPANSTAIQQAPQAPPPQPASSGHASDTGDLEAVTGAGMELGLNPVADIIAAGVLVVDALGNVAGNISRVGADFVQISETVMNGGEHMASSLTDSAGDIASATVDWVPIIGGALGQIVSVPFKIQAQVLRLFEDMGRFVGDTMRSAAQAGASVLEFDAKSLASQMADVAERRIPVFGTVIKGATDSVFALDKAVESAAGRLADFHGGLAQQRAFEEMATLLRDMDRARRFGDQIQRAEGARFQFDMALQRLGDRFTPFITALSERLFTVLGTLVDFLDERLRTVLESLDAAVMFLKQLAITPEPIRQILRNVHELIRSALDNQNAPINFLDEEFRRMRDTNRLVPGAQLPGASQPQPLPMPGV